MAAEPSTRDRVLDAALLSFGTRGYEATSLDQVAAELGVRKQTILYYFPSKAELLDAVLDHASAELIAALGAAVARAGPGYARVEAIVRSVFRLALRRPELLGLLRDVGRLGPEPATRLHQRLDPLVASATGFLEDEMAAGRIRASDARLLLLSVYSTVLGVATEVEVLRAVGIEPTLRTTAVRRRELLRFLRSALVVVPDGAEAPTAPTAPVVPGTAAPVVPGTAVAPAARGTSVVAGPTKSSGASAVPLVSAGAASPPAAGTAPTPARPARR